MHWIFLARLKSVGFCCRKSQRQVSSRKSKNKKNPGESTFGCRFMMQSKSDHHLPYLLVEFGIHMVRHIHTNTYIAHATELNLV